MHCHQARIAEEAGACAVMALERVPADIRKEGSAHHTLLSNFVFNDIDPRWCRSYGKLSRIHSKTFVLMWIFRE